MRDPLFNAIKDALSGTLDGDVFEACFCDLLRDAYPDLVPLQGGSDDGMDGTIGEDGFLVCTTGTNVIGNLTGSLNQHLKVNGRRRRVVSVTSQELTPRKKRNLENRATELGFKLLQIIDQPALIPRLYHSPQWRKELLGISGHPPALTAIARTRRPLLDVNLVGRGDTIEWLRNSDGDRMLVGGPGSGKTAVTTSLAREGWGLFVSTENTEALADAVRDQRPSVVIVDDAHIDPDQLVRLRHLRETIGATFDLLATTWPGGESAVRESLGDAAEDRIHVLPLLTRDELVEVVRRAGISGPPDLVKLIVDQASNQPGLAVTLAGAARAGSFEDLTSGRALARYLTTWLSLTAESHEQAVLAAFSLGGSSGIEIQVVSTALALRADS